MSLILKTFLVLFFSLLILNPTLILAQDQPAAAMTDAEKAAQVSEAQLEAARKTIAEEEKKKQLSKLPKRGTLSSSVSAPGGGATSADVWGEGSATTDSEPSPITGSVSRVSGSQWVAKLFNNSKDRYQVSVKVIQYDAKGRALKSDNFSFTLNANESRNREIATRSGTDRCDLQLVSWKNLSAKL